CAAAGKSGICPQGDIVERYIALLGEDAAAFGGSIVKEQYPVQGCGNAACAHTAAVVVGDRPVANGQVCKGDVPAGEHVKHTVNKVGVHRRSALALALNRHAVGNVEIAKCVSV